MEGALEGILWLPRNLELAALCVKVHVYHEIGGPSERRAKANRQIAPPTMPAIMETIYADAETVSVSVRGEGDGNGRWVRRWFGTGASNNNETEYLYDVRSRRQVSARSTEPILQPQLPSDVKN